MTGTEDPGGIDVYYAVLRTVLNGDAEMTVEKALIEGKETYHQPN